MSHYDYTVELLRHTNSKDVAIQVLEKEYHLETDSWHLLVIWWNIGPHRPFIMGPDNIRIKSLDLINWVPYRWLGAITESKERELYQ